jgi:hypothetical protein
VFGALNHIDSSGNARKKTGEDAFGDADWSQVSVYSVLLHL